jgi:hypothetical protein
VNHLSGLKNNQLIEIWDDRKILIGEKWDDKINDELVNSDIVLFLMSSDFLASEYINRKEIVETIERHKKGEVCIIPILLRPCDVTSSILSSFQSVPRDLKFINSTSFGSIDEGFLAVVKELKKTIEEFKPKKSDNASSDDIKERDGLNNCQCCAEDYEIDISMKVLYEINGFIEKNACSKCKRGKYDDIENSLKIRFSNEKDIRVAINYLIKEKCIEFSYAKDRYKNNIEYISITLEGEKSLRRFNR